jgi:hypothetical protein
LVITPLLAAFDTAIKIRFGMSPMLLEELLGTSIMVMNHRLDKRS